MTATARHGGTPRGNLAVHPQADVARRAGAPSGGGPGSVSPEPEGPLSLIGSGIVLLSALLTLFTFRWWAMWLIDYFTH